MKKSSALLSTLLNSFAGTLIITLLSSTQLTAQPFKLVAVSDMVQVFEDGYNMPATSDTIQVFGIRGEVLSGQCVVSTKNNLTGVSLEISAPKHQVSGKSLAANTIGWDFVGSIPLAKNASNQPKQTVVRQAPARFPDYLMAERQMNINKGAYQPIWLTITIPGNAEAGIYSGKVTVKSSQGEQSLPLIITVYPLTLPSERHLKVTEWYTTGRFAKWHGIQEQYSDEWFAMLKKYAENMAAHRQNVFQVPAASIEIKKNKSGEFEFDFNRFDQIAQVFWNTGKMNYIETGELGKFDPGGFSSKSIKFKDFSVTVAETGEKQTIPGDQVVPYLLPAFESHLRQKGWLDKTLFHIKDEPAHHNALEWLKLSRTVHQYAPDLKRFDALCTSFVISDLEIAVPKLDMLDSGYEIFRKWQEQGNELWFYTVGIFEGSSYPNKTIDMPVIGSRILHWLNYKYSMPGYLHWGWNQWVDDPYNETGEHTGDGYHVYPVKDGVLNSIRWEQMRNGIQDYEYFWMLEQKVKALKDSLGSRFSWIDPTQRGREITSQVATSLVRHSTDPKVLNKAKKDLINDILDFNTSPRVYIQTSPPENGTLINRSVLELLGWVEPGSQVTVNGDKLDVAKDGLILGRYLIYVGGKIQVNVKKDGKEKTITRVYNVTY